MKAPTDNLDDLQSDIAHLSEVMDIIVETLLDTPRFDGSNKLLDRSIALSWIARDMADMLRTEADLCHQRVLQEARARKRGGSLQ
ncbi:hypothetical protein NKH47_17905 [Mesorhizobium sp. M1060]|uniref:hypothetical protein n=1 Tax=unclassified Mesorhizobium TaxID=325217 RepID=UPI0003CF8A09|nr:MULTISPECIES: hypothetical protein [unclassified Mesorhizobium]ESX32881.1 hypothetical protein X765_03850 [Mesorhizobium sp. LSHC440B00]ESX40049.1 hypothetical protein X763_04570 [Mesorhizobium sp. LSHC432A00]ESX44943.1 hypothetical protein X764_03590 [Mesorhizobium sp. LSHC440A00]WJI59319.1 hypothetical protein NLY33_11660 [Mesorhizobium sp. C432A]